MKQFQICIIQPEVIPLNIEKNVKYCTEIITKVCKQYNPQLVVLPETITTGFSLKQNVIPQLYKKLKHVLPVVFSEIGKVAKKCNTYIVFPTYEPSNVKNKFYNSAFFFSPKGHIESIYRKIFLFPTEKWSIPGKKPVVWKTKFVKLGCVICFDGDFPELVRHYALSGVEVVVRPSAFLRNYEIWFLTNSSRAYENQIYFCAVNNIGQDYCGKVYYGHSMIVDPYGRVICLVNCNHNFFITTLIPKNKLDTSNIIKIDHITHFIKQKGCL